MGDYLPAFNFATPQRIGGNGNTGLGIDFTSPGGYFSSGVDFTQWGIAEWGTLVAGVYLMGSVSGDTRRQVRKSRAAAKAYRKTR